MRKKIAALLIFIAITSSSLYFGLPRLHNFSGVDEPYWSYDRVPKFWESIKKHKWKSTNLCDKPGITLAIISGAGLPFIGQDPRNYEDLRYEAKTPEQVQEIRDAYYHLRLPVFIFTLLMLPVFYILIKKLLGEKTANFSLIFIGFSPILLGISLIINSDSILWILTALSSLSLFVFLKTGEKKYLILSGFLLGLSVITKFVANVLFVYFFLTFMMEYIFHAHKNQELGKYLRSSLLDFLILLVTAMATAFIFFPATWVKFSTLLNATVTNPVFSSTLPLFVGVIVLLGLDALIFKSKFSGILFNFLVKYKNILAKIISAVFLVLVAIVFLHIFFHVDVYDIQGLISSPKGIGAPDENSLDASDASIKNIIASSKGTPLGTLILEYPGAILADTFSLLFSISPLVLIMLLASAIMIWRKKELERDSITVIYIITFILIFYLGSTVNNVITTVRYQIMVYPLAFVAAAIGFSQLLEMEKIKKFIPTYTMYILSVLILFSSLYFIKPNFLAYASEALPHNDIVNLKGMGEGSVEAAFYLNALPGAHDMTIWSDKGAVCEAFVGNCMIDFKKKTFEENNFNFFVVSTDRESRSLKMSGGVNDVVNFKNLYRTDKPTFEIIIGGREVNFVKVINAKDNTK